MKSDGRFYFREFHYVLMSTATQESLYVLEPWHSGKKHLWRVSMKEDNHLVPSSTWNPNGINFILILLNYEIIQFWEAQFLFVLDQEVKCTVNFIIPSLEGGGVSSQTTVMVLAFPFASSQTLHFVDWPMPREAMPPSGQTEEASLKNQSIYWFYIETEK